MIGNDFLKPKHHAEIDSLGYRHCKDKPKGPKKKKDCLSHYPTLVFCFCFCFFLFFFFFYYLDYRLLERAAKSSSHLGEQSMTAFSWDPIGKCFGLYSY
jgi:hypothetical protein